MMSFPHKGRQGSFSSDDGSHHAAAKAAGSSEDKFVDKPTLIYHESARSIVFRDQVRRASMDHHAQHQHQRTTSSSSTHSLSNFFQPSTFSERSADGAASDVVAVLDTTAAGTNTEDDDAKETAIQIHGFTPIIQPLPTLEYSADDTFTPLIESSNGEEDDEAHKEWTVAEREVVNMLKHQRAVVKTVKNGDWTALLNRFRSPKPPSHYSKKPREQDDIGPHEGYPFNSFVTSTSMLPPFGRKMRSYGSPSQFTTGVIFGLPTAFPKDASEDEAAARTQTWSWPAGYSAKTEFNIDSQGQLINGRQEAIVPISTLRQYNDDYIHKEDYMVGHRLIKGGFDTVPYNEVFVRVGGLGRIVDGKDWATGEERNDADGTGRSLDKGVGLPVALFVRMPTYGHLLSLLRTRARIVHVLGEKHIQGIPLLFMTPELGVRVLTDSLQRELLLIAARNLNPFQNPLLVHKTTIDETTEDYLKQKLEELIDLDQSIRSTLTPEECARLAGGFGATDESVAAILKDALDQDKQTHVQSSGADISHRTQDIVNEGLAAAVRAGDYHTARQLLLLYSLVSSLDFMKEQEKKRKELENGTEENGDATPVEKPKRANAFDADSRDVLKWKEETGLSTGSIPAPPPPPLDTERLRSATNSDGLLAVLGAAEVLKSMQDGSARRRTEECVLAVEEWVEHGEQSIAFRLASWRDQRAAQDDLKIATEGSSNLMAFVSNKAISNRKAFAQQLRESVSQTDFTDFRFLQAIHLILSKMHSPCLRLELLQYVLGLDNRFSVAHVTRSIELAATCLSIGTAQPV